MAHGLARQWQRLAAMSCYDTSALAANDNAALQSPENQSQELRLSARERDVLEWQCRGRSYKQIADELGVSIDTVRSHVRRLYRKLRVHSVSEAVVKALRERLVETAG